MRIRALSTLVLVLFLSPIYNCTTKKDNTIDNLALLLILGSIINESCKHPSPVKGGTDPLFSSQWHLSQASGEDAGVTVPWNNGIFGSGITVAVVDDGMETTHEDLCGNLSRVSSYNYLQKSRNPNHYYTDTGHGTNVAGVIAAQYNNNVGLRGASPGAKLTARNILELQFLGSADIADSMTRDISDIHISNNSWGAPDGSGLYNDDFASSLWKSAIESGIATGRGGKGTVYTWAGGNGHYLTDNSGTRYEPFDNSNLDGQANFHGVLAICGIGKDGTKAAYSEEGANLWVCAHTMGDDYIGISTTDRTGNKGQNTSSTPDDSKYKAYTNSFNGTSSSAPLAAGVIALLLEKYPDLSWRDVREILAKSARKNHSGDTDWSTNGANYNINHKYGFGAIHAGDALQRAAIWTRITSPYISESFTNSSSNNTITFTTSSSTIRVIEFIEVIFSTTTLTLTNLPITRIEMGIELINESNQTGCTSNCSTSSILMEPHYCNDSTSACASRKSFRFGTARHLGEDARNGTWKINISNLSAGTRSATLKFYGRAN